MSISKLQDLIKSKLGKTNPDILHNPDKGVERISSGDLIWDLVTSGGFPKGRITEVYGRESSAKSAIALSAASLLQKEKKGVSLLLDFEHAYYAPYVSGTFGLKEDGESFMVVQPMCAEEGADVLDLMEESGVVLDFVIIDSVDACRPRAWLEGSLSDEARVGAHAKAMGRFVAKARTYASRHNTAFVFINQLRSAINTAMQAPQGSGFGFDLQGGSATTGGHALRYYASLRVQHSYGGQITDDSGFDQVTGNTGKVRTANYIRVEVAKSRVGTPYLRANAIFEFPAPGVRGGWRPDKEAMEILKKRGHIRQAGTKFVYNGLNMDWSNLGSKKESERLWSENVEIQKDVRLLLSSILNRGNSVLETLSTQEINLLQKEDSEVGSSSDGIVSLGLGAGD